MVMENEYEYKIYYGQKGFLIIVPINLLMIFLLLFILTNIPHEKVLEFYVVSILLMAILLYPFIFANKIRKIFTNSVKWRFNPESFIIVESDLKNNNVLNTYVYNYCDVKGYRFYFTGINTTHLVIYLSNGKAKDFGIIDGYNNSEAINNINSFLRTFHSHIIDYNKDLIGDSINIKRSFLDTKSGSILFIFLGIFFLVAFVVHILIQPSTSFSSLLVGLLMILNLFNLRNQSNKIYSQLIELPESNFEK